VFLIGFTLFFSTYKLPGLALCSDVQSMDYRVFSAAR
jgi:hypothetical protein